MKSRLQVAEERIAELEREKSTLFGLNLGLCTAAGHSEHLCDVKLACADVERLRYTERNDQACDALLLAMAEGLQLLLQMGIKERGFQADYARRIEKLLAVTQNDLSAALALR